MKITDTCTDCLLSRVSLECRLCAAGEDVTRTAHAECGRLLDRLRNEPLSHPQIASAVHRRAYEIIGNPDPFAALKREGNREAMEVCRGVRSTILSFRDHVLASVIGNTFDYGVKGHTVDTDFAGFFRNEYAKGLTIDDTGAIRKICSRVVYLSDNCGEIVLDKLLISWLKAHGSHVTLAVKGKPALNDATLDDARELGLDRMVDLLTTNGGGAEIGIALEEIPGDLRDALDRCTVVIAKGMANYESLSEMEGIPPVAYLLAAKCRPVADEIGVPVGSKIAMLRR